jgi:ferritin-like metal-binding protein YciE
LDISRGIAAPYEDTLRDFFADETAALRVLETIGQCAQNGIPSEDVVKHLERVASQEFLKVLKGQLELKILETKQVG